MKKIKILLPILVLTILFIVSFILQSKYNHIILNAVDVEQTEALFLKQIVMFGGSFMFLNLLIVSIVICFLVMFAILVFVLINRRRMENRAKIKEKLTVLYQKLILDALEDKIIDNTEFKAFKKICNNRFKRNILINQIIDVALMLPVDIRAKLRKLYFDLGLINETRRKLYSRHWHHKIKGMKELSHLEIKDYNDIIMNYTNAKNDTLRMEAQIAMVRLSDDENPFLFLENLQHDFSIWEQITLHQLMIESDMKVPNFGRWLFSDNYSVGMFCLRMIREYNQIKNVDDLERMLFHPCSDVMNLTIQIIGDLNLESLIYTLKKRYKDEPYLNRLEIVKSLGKIGSSKSINFLQKLVDFETDTQLQIEAVKAINNTGEIGKIYLEKMLNSDYKDYNIIIKHVLDSRIN